MDNNIDTLFDGILDALPATDRVQRQAARDLRRELHRLKNSEAALIRDLEDERREALRISQTPHGDHEQRQQELVDLRQELQRTRNVAEHYKAQAESASVTVGNLSNRLEKALEEKKKAEEKVKDLTSELNDKSGSSTLALHAFKPVVADTSRSLSQGSPSDCQTHQPTTGGNTAHQGQEGVVEVDSGPVRAQQPTPPPIEAIRRSTIVSSLTPDDDLDDGLKEEDTQVPVIRSKANDNGKGAAESRGPRLPRLLPRKVPVTALGNAGVEAATKRITRSNKRSADGNSPDTSSSRQPVKRRKENSSAVSGVAVRQMDEVDKLSVRRFVEARTRTIWDTACDMNLNLPAFMHEDRTYKICDLVNYRNNWGDSKGGDVLETSKKLPDAWSAVLCDYSTGDPFPIEEDDTSAHPEEDDTSAHPVHGDGDVTHVALMWLFSKHDIKVNISGGLKNHKFVDLDDKAIFKKTFMGANVSARQRFLSAELEWMEVGGLCGHLNPREVGNSAASARTIFVDWTGPVIDYKEEWRPKSQEEDGPDKLTHIYTVKKRSGLANAHLPDGWVHENY